MTQITLVRHGQANTHAQDAASYDRLSDLGQQQAKWLGDHFTLNAERFDHIETGTLLRQRQTAAGMGYPPIAQNAAWDEMDYFALSDAAQKYHNIPAPKDASEFARHLPQVLDLWRADDLPGVPETHAEFTGKIQTALTQLQGRYARVLIVTSGGVIGAALRYVLGLDTLATTKIMLQVQNSSVHQLQYVHDQFMLAAFNATPHLDHPDRAHARTRI